VFGCLLVGWLLFLGGRARLRRPCSAPLLVLFSSYSHHSTRTTSNPSCTTRSSGRASAWWCSASPGSPWDPPTTPRSAPPGAGVGHRRRGDAGDPPHPRGGGSDLLALHRTQGHEQVLALRGVMLPGVRGPLAPGAACVQRRFPRAAVPGAGVAGDAVIAEARTGERHHERRMGHVIGLFARNGTPFPFRVPPPGDDARSHVHHPGVRGCGPSSLPLRS